MTELRVEIPREIETEFSGVSNVELSIIVSRVLKEELSRLVRFKEIVSKSKLKEDDAAMLANEVSESLAKRYEKLPAK